MPKASQSILRNNGGVTGLGAGPPSPGGGSEGVPLLLSAVPPFAPFFVRGFFGLGMLILSFQFDQKKKGELLKKLRHLSIQKFGAGHYGRLGWPKRSRWNN